MAPVSVIHHVSNTRLSYTSLDHLITSGLSGSPTDKIERNDDRSYFSTTSSPRSLTFLMCRRSIPNCYFKCFNHAIPLFRENRPPAIQFVTPFNHGANTP